MIKGVTCIILAGGKSSRMGRDKSFIPFSGRPLVETVIEKMARLFREPLIITNSPHLYSKYGIEIHSDILRDRGPLGGIHAGLAYSKNRYNFVVACDMPFLNEGLISFMVEGLGDYDAVVPRYEGRLEPLCAVYSKTCIRFIEGEILKGNLKITDFLKQVKTRIIEEDLVSIKANKHSFININTPEDLSRCQLIISSVKE